MMIIIWTIVITIAIKLLFNWLYNIVFFTIRKPKIWLVCVSLLGIISALSSKLFDEGIEIHSLSILIVAFLVWPPKNKDKAMQEEINKFAEEIYREMGISNGNLIYKLGVVFFVIAAGITWAVLYVNT